MINLVTPRFEIIDKERTGERLLRKLEEIGRTSYKSEDKITIDSWRQFIAKLKSMGDWSVLEHESISVRFIIDRGVSHELVRHRLASYTQESTRFVNYNKKGMAFIDIQEHFKKYLGAKRKNDLEISVALNIWFGHMQDCEVRYNKLIELGLSPSLARSVLPNSLKTEIVMTTNPRVWHHVFHQRTAKGAHPQMREVMMPLLEQFKLLVPILYDDLPSDNPTGA